MLEVPGGGIRQHPERHGAAKDWEGITGPIRRWGLRWQRRQHHSDGLEPGVIEDAHEPVERGIGAEQGTVDDEQLTVDVQREMWRSRAGVRDATHCSPQSVYGP